MENIRIPLTKEELGVDEIDRNMAYDLAEGITQETSLMPGIVASIIEKEEKFIDDKEGLKKKFSDMSLDVIKEDNNGLTLVCENIPRDALSSIDGKYGISERQKSQIIHAARDLYIPANGKIEDEMQSVKAMLLRAGIISENPEENIRTKEQGGRTFVQGGHKVARPEYSYAKKVAYEDALTNKTEYITGCGPDIMKAPFKGAQIAYGHRDIHEHKDYIGFTEPKIVAAEPPNGLVNKLVVFRNIAERMMGFIAAANRGRVHEGGVGTLQEVLTFLSVITDEKNRDNEYILDLLGSGGGEYMKRLKKYFETIFKEQLNGHLKFHFGTSPRDFAQYVWDTNPEEMKVWNEDIYFPEEVRKPSKVNFDEMEKIDLSSNQPISKLLKNLEKLFNAHVEMTIINPKVVKSWGKDRPLIKGDPKILKATQDLIDSFYQEKRIPRVVENGIFRID